MAPSDVREGLAAAARGACGRSTWAQRVAWPTRARRRKEGGGRRHGHAAAGGIGRGSRSHGWEIRHADVAKLSKRTAQTATVLPRRIPAGDDQERSLPNLGIERKRTRAKSERSTSQNHGGQPSRRRGKRLPRVQNQRSQRQTAQKKLRIFHVAVLMPQLENGTRRWTRMQRHTTPKRER